jgi:guanylate kinase
MLNKKGFSIILSAPSGVGKTTLVKELKKIQPNLVFSVSATTREKRKTEVDGIDYYFKTKEEFQYLIKNNELLEFTEKYNNYYGTLKSTVEQAESLGKIILFDVEYLGAMNLKSKLKNSITIFILPPSINELKNRLTSRLTESKASLDLRLSKAKEDCQTALEYDYVILNNDFQTALTDFHSIITSNTLKNNSYLNLKDFLKNL